MANPQLENGHTQIANEILEHLMLMHLSANQWQVLLCIIRKTYGFHKKVDHIANSQIVTATGLCKAVVSRALHSLADLNIISRNAKTIGFQKDWERWGKLAIPSTLNPKLAEQLTAQKLAIQSTELAIQSTELAIQSTKVSSPAVAQKKKETITKETIQKKVYVPKTPYGQEFRNVLLTHEEYQRLVDKFGTGGAEDRIEELSQGIESKGYKYVSHYAAILAWERRKRKEVSDVKFDPIKRYSKQRVPSHYTNPEDL